MIKEILYEKILYLLEEISINYKTWLAFILGATILADYNVGNGFLYFIYCYFISYLTHRFLHNDFFYTNIYNIAHEYHHAHSDWFAIIMNCIVEFLAATNNIAIKYTADSFSFCNLFFINQWVILFVYLWYTTIHNINYGYLKINKYHLLHHDNCQKNIGPDVFDCLFNTKHKSSLEIEETDHYVPNILFSFMVVYGLKCIYEGLEMVQQEKCKVGFAILWILSTTVLTLFSCYTLYSQIKDAVDKDLESFL